MENHALTYRWPAEWESHAATWIAWPFSDLDWPGKYGAVTWALAEICRNLVRGGELARILCQEEHVAETARVCLMNQGVDPDCCQFHLVLTDRCWLRDSLPTAVYDTQGRVIWIGWRFNGWAKYGNHLYDQAVPETVAQITGLPLMPATIPQTGSPLVLEGGAIDGDGQGTLLATEECLLSPDQLRNPGLGRADYEALFERYLGAKKTLWLGRGVIGDDTHGHVDDVARFVAPGVVALAFEQDPADPNHETAKDNLARMQSARDAHGRPLRIVTLPMPEPVIFAGQRLPASYANFFIANRRVLVPTFNDPHDRIALELLAREFPTRTVVGIHALDLVLGLGTIHCLTQQQPCQA